MKANTEIATVERIDGPDRAPGALLDVQGAAKLCACSKRHVIRMSDAGKMPRPLKLGALVRWRRAELETWIGAGCPAVRSVKGGAR